MKKLILIIGVLASLYQVTWAQTAVAWNLSLAEHNNSPFPGLHSAAFGQYGGKWYFFGGRLDGLHARQAWAIFRDSLANHQIIINDPYSLKHEAVSTEGLPEEIQLQLGSTNMQFFQRNDSLFLIGGFGYVPAKDDFTTYPQLTIVDLKGLSDRIKNKQPIAPAFTSLQHDLFRITGGQVMELGGWICLAGGHTFDGSYNPMGPTMGDGFKQTYSNAVHRFQIRNGSEIIIGHSDQDTILLHKRDFNMAPQILPNGELGAMLFSGVFQYEENIPWLNAVELNANGIKPIDGFEQLLSQYHCAHLPIYDALNGSMQTIFFGGMARYIPLDSGGLQDDINVPFVKTISYVNRLQDGSMAEYNTRMTMPHYLGAGAAFIPANRKYWENGILHLDRLSAELNLVGYIYGGIESKQDNTFFEDEDGLTWASDALIEVYISPKYVPIIQNKMGGVWWDPERKTAIIQSKCDRVELRVKGSNKKAALISGKGVTTLDKKWLKQEDFNVTFYPLPAGAEKPKTLKEEFSLPMELR